MNKISLFCEESLSENVKNSLEDLSIQKNVSQISVLPDVYQKEHTIWPTGITVVADDFIFPEIISGSGCGISVFKIGSDISKTKNKKIMEIIYNSITDYKTINSYFNNLNINNSILNFNDFLNRFELNSITDPWRNDTQSEMRFKTLEESLIEEYLTSDLTNKGRVIIEGNHFVELQSVEEIYDPNYMKLIGLSKGDILLTLHFEDEGLNIQMEEKFKKKYNLKEIKFPSQEAEEFITLTNIGQRYCFMNRIIIGKYILNQIKKEKINTEESFILDTTHTGLFKEESERNTKIYHTSGTTIALPPNHLKLKEKIREFGQPLLLPGALGIESYLMKSSYGTINSSYTINHGLGRKISKEYARSNYSEDQVRESFKYPDLIVRKISDWDLVSQMNTCYKDINSVLKTLYYNNLALKVAKLQPLGTLKG